MIDDDDDLDELFDLRMRAVGSRIRALRRARDLSQEFLAERAGIHRSSLARAESRGVNLTLATVYRLADALGVHPADLLDDREH